MLTILQDAISGRQNLPDNYVEAPNAVDEFGNYYYKPPMTDTEVQQIGESSSAGYNGDQGAIDITGSQRTRVIRNTIQNAVKTQADLDMDRIEATEGTVRMMTPEERQADTLEDILEDQQQQREDDNKANRILSGAKFFINVMNAESAYSSFESAAILNIQNKRMQANDAIQRGRERAFQAESEGRRLSEDVLLRMAAQGQDVSGLNTQSLQRSYEAVAAQNALQEETNAIREALGFQLEEVSINYELAQRETQRDMTILSSALQYGAEYWSYS